MGCHLVYSKFGCGSEKVLWILSGAEVILYAEPSHMQLQDAYAAG